MQRQMLGKTGIEVSKLCFGTLTMSYLQRDLTPQKGANLLLYAYDNGIDFCDTAMLYETYAHIAAALKHRKGLIVSSKAYCFDTATAKVALDEALKAIGRDYIDIFLLHEQESIHTLRGHEEALNYLNKQKKAGMIRAVGISTHYVAAVAAATRFGGIDVIHPLINSTGLGIADGTRDEMQLAIDDAHNNGIGIFSMKPLGGGHLIKRAADAFDYLLHQPSIDSIAVGMQSIAEIDYNIALISGQKPNDDVLSKLNSQERRLLIQSWCAGCGCCVKRCACGALTILDGKAQVDDKKCVLCGYCAGSCPEFCIKVI